MYKELSGVTPSQNIVDRSHWTKKSALRDEWYWLVKAGIGIKNPTEQNPVQVSIVRVSKRLIDDANVPSGCKYLIDALVVFGWAVDDAREWMRVEFDQRKCRTDEEPHMEITVSPYPSKAASQGTQARSQRVLQEQCH